jgi:hypothetical protein
MDTRLYWTAQICLLESSQLVENNVKRRFYGLFLFKKIFPYPIRIPMRRGFATVCKNYLKYRENTL